MNSKNLKVSGSNPTEVISQHLRGGSEENHEELQSRYPMPELTFNRARLENITDTLTCSVSETCSVNRHHPLHYVFIL